MNVTLSVIPQKTPTGFRFCYFHGQIEEFQGFGKNPDVLLCPVLVLNHYKIKSNRENLLWKCLHQFL